MCRIVGIKSKNKEKPLASIRDSLSHGGPDAANVYFSPDETVALGHRRLSILDLSDAGTQPMQWGDWVICYNGEVYNFEEIKSKMPDYQFTTGTDTEVIIKAFDKWGYNSVHHFRGMFAFALYNIETQNLILCRDRIGVKPLFWYKKKDLFMFASELKAFHEHPQFDKTINQKAVSLFLQQGYIPAPDCIFKFANKLEPGHFLKIDIDENIKKIKYWDPEEIHQNSKIDNRDEETISDELEEIMSKSFKLRMVADVPVGMFLSGGIDSSLVTALIQKQMNTSVKTFTIGFEDKDLNEAEFARKISQHLKTEHTELYCTEKDAQEVIPVLAEYYDEPFGDSSAIPTFLVSRLAKEQVTVSLSADGGDELFGGYTKYEISKKYYDTIGKLPSFAKTTVASLASRINPSWVNKYGQTLPILKNYKDLNNKFSKFQKAVSAKDLTAFFNIASTYISEKEIVNYHTDFKSRFQNENIKCDPNRIISYLGMIDIKTYLEGDIMTKVDRATMRVALEGREPFLDHHIIEFSQRIPDNLKIKNGKTKYLLRQILYKHVPKELIERPKMGFAIPIEKWLKSLLIDKIKSIAEDKVFFEKFNLNDNTIKNTISNFFSQEKYVNPHVIWFIFILHQWYERWIK